MLNLNQVYPLHPQKGYTLDLCFCDSSEFSIVCYEKDICLVKVDEHHYPIMFEIKNIKYSNYSNVKVKDYCFYKADYVKINDYLINYNWGFLENFGGGFNDLQLVFDKFYNIIKSVIDKFVPVRSYRVDEFPHWFDAELVQLINHKKELHRLW